MNKITRKYFVETHIQREEEYIEGIISDCVESVVNCITDCEFRKRKKE